jgi:excisionase family DNA binding protein
METLLSVAEAARLLGVTGQTVRLMARKGSLQVAARTEGGVRLFNRVDVERLAADRASRAASRPQVVGAP